MGIPSYLLQHAEKLGANISQKGIEEFITAQLESVSGLVLNLGAGYRRFNELTGGTEIAVDIVSNPVIDVVADAHFLPFKTDSFECAVLREVLEHLSSPELAVAELSRVLKPGGKVALTTSTSSD